MTATVVLILFAALLAVDLVRRARAVPGEAAMTILLAGFPRALLLATAAMTFGAWQVRQAYEGIATSGYGGIRTVAEPAYELLRLSLAGALACIAVLSTSVLLVWRARAVPPPVPVTPAPAGVSWLRTFGVVLGCVCVGYGLIAAEQFALVPLVPLLDRVAVPPPSAYAHLSSVPERVELIGRLVMQLSVGGLIVSIVLAIQTIGAGFDLKRGSLPAGVRAVLPVLASAMVLIAAWRSIHLGSAMGWLSGVLERVRP